MIAFHWPSAATQAGALELSAIISELQFGQACVKMPSFHIIQPDRYLLKCRHCIQLTRLTDNDSVTINDVLAVIT